MNDAGLGENIEHHASAAEDQLDLPNKYKFENDAAHEDPSRWWFASSAFPMIAGTLGPVASAFSICALVRPWRQHYPPGSDVSKAVFIEDPPWLTIVNAFQLAIAVISNMFLLLNMARRVRFGIAQPATIIGWYISAICLLTLCACASGPLQEGLYPVDEYIWSQAFWYGIWAAILYFIDASLMVVTFYGALKGHYAKDFVLTASQRTLMLQTIMFLMYLLLGALVFSTIEGWNYLDGVYWADVTLFTVGLGDYSPATALGRALMMPYALIGIISLGLVIGSIRSMVLERGKRRLDARMAEKKRRRKVRTMTIKGNDNILSPIEPDSPQRPDSLPQDAPPTEYERRREEFKIMRQIQDQVSARRRWVALAISTSAWLVLWLVGAYIFLEMEKPYQPQWNYFQAFFFCFTVLTTIGYGDLTPISNAGKSFFVFWSLLALPTMTVLISNAGDTLVKFVRDGTIYLGNITILPGEASATHNIKVILNTFTNGKLFPKHAKPVVAKDNASSRPRSQNARDEENQTPYDSDNDNENETGLPGFLGAAEDEDERERRDNRSLRRPSSTFTSRVRRDLPKLRDPLDELPTGTNLYYLLVSEIQIVGWHVRASKPKHYTYDEWAWYLRLIGEDERSPQTHRKARPRPKKHHHRLSPADTDQCSRQEAAQEDREEETLTKWSWVGHRSPLMGSQEESEWILERLCERLKELLSAEGRRQGDGEKTPASKLD